MKCSKNDVGSIERKLVNFLLVYRNIVYVIINEILVKFMMGRELRMKMDFLRLNIELYVK